LKVVMAVLAVAGMSALTKPPTNARAQAPGQAPTVTADEVVIRIGEKTLTVGELQAALSYQPEGALDQLKQDGNALRYFAIQWFHRMVFTEGARANGFLAKKSGLEEAAADRGRRLISDEYVRDTGQEYAPTDAEIEQFYSIHREHCVVTARFRLARIGVLIGRHASEDEQAAARKRMDAIEKRLRDGEAFAAVVADSNDMPEKLPGGELGWVTSADLAQGDLGADKFMALSPGGMTEVLRTPRGYEIFKLLEKDEPRTMTLEECRPKLAEKIRKEFYESVRVRRADELVEQLGASMNIDTFFAAVRSAKAPQPAKSTP
jgi:hypothetical protein